MKVLLTGPFGKIGYRVIEALLAKGYEPVCFDLDTKTNRKTAREFLSSHKEGNRITLLWGDITNRQSVADAVQGVDAVIHNAAIIPPMSDRNPVLAEKVNVGGTQNMIQAIQQSPNKPWLIFPSSISIHGNHLPDSPTPKKITDPLQAEDCYAGHKIKCEELIEKSGLDFVIVRIGACLEGRSTMDSSDTQSALEMMFSISARCRLEYVHPKDVATAMVNAIFNPAALGKKFFLGGGKACQTSWLEFNSLYIEAMGCGSFPEQAYGRGGYYTDWMDTEESQRVLQFQHHTLNDYRAELSKKFKWIKPLLFPLRSVIKNYLLNASPYWKEYKNSEQVL